MSEVPQENRLLAGLSDSEHERLLPNLELVRMNLGEVVYEHGVKLNYAYFPIDCIVSLLSVMDNGDSSEIGMIGNDGVVGMCLILGEGVTTGRAVVQSEGNALRMKGELLKTEFARAGHMQQVLLKYLQASLSMISQTAACNKHHSTAQQLCRWLLLGLDRLPGNRLFMTQGLVANMLGVRWDVVTDATGALEADGLITFTRGTFTVLDRIRLERAACECYAAVKHEFDRLLPDQRGHAPRETG
ncbi:MAG: Crp/Fnr family transcriptional regulator [Pseudomonadota bacterium]|nr:Crp/Fnr family transcriptional regulator [Pseudomonadota bacterium]